MQVLLDVASWAFLVTGSAMLIIGAVGVVRLPDVFARMHGVGIIDTMGAGAVLVGLMFQAGFTGVTLKLALIAVFILFTGPTATHALARAALNGGVHPALADREPGDAEPEGDESSTT